MARVHGVCMCLYEDGVSLCLPVCLSVWLSIIRLKAAQHKSILPFFESWFYFIYFIKNLWIFYWLNYSLLTMYIHMHIWTFHFEKVLIRLQENIVDFFYSLQKISNLIPFLFFSLPPFLFFPLNESFVLSSFVWFVSEFLVKFLTFDVRL